MPVEFQFDFERTLAAVTFLASKEVPELTKYKLCKLLFLADKHHLVKYGRVITGDKYCAIPHGPIPSRTLDLLNAVINQNLRDSQSTEMSQALELERQYVYPRFRAAKISDLEQLSESDLASLTKIIEEYGRMGFPELEAITHQMFAYKQPWSRRPEGVNGVDMSFEDFFEEDPDAVVGAHEAMMEDDSLRKAFPER